MNSTENNTRGGRVSEVISTITGYRYAKQNVGYLKNRLSFPLLRENVRALYENARNKNHPDFEKYSDFQLSRSIISHRFLQISFAGIFIYSLLLTTKGIAALVRFDSITLWLAYGPLLLLIACMQLATSTTAVRAQKAELMRRAGR